MGIQILEEKLISSINYLKSSYLVENYKTAIKISIMKKNIIPEKTENNIVKKEGISLLSTA